MENQLTVIQNESSFSAPANFEHAQRVAKMLSTSDLVPAQYKGNLANTMIALEMSNRLGANPLMVMQNLFIVQGKPSWSSSFIIAAINSCKKFSPLRFEMGGQGDTRSCTAWAIELDTNERLDGPTVTMQMAKDEGWLGKPGSKWKTMPELMIRYRSAAFFGRLYAPEIMMGMQTMEEIVDVKGELVKPAAIQKNKEAERVAVLIEEAETPQQLEQYAGQLALFPELQEAYKTKLETLSTVDADA